MKRLIAATVLCGLPFVPAAAGEGDPRAGKKKAEEVCAACHGADGMSPTPQFPHLAGQYASYLVKALEDYQSGARKNAIMAPFAANLSEQDRENLAAHFSRQRKLRVIEYNK